MKELKNTNKNNSIFKRAHYQTKIISFRNKNQINESIGSFEKIKKHPHDDTKNFDCTFNDKDLLDFDYNLQDKTLLQNHIKKETPLAAPTIRNCDLNLIQVRNQPDITKNQYTYSVIDTIGDYICEIQDGITSVGNEEIITKLINASNRFQSVHFISDGGGSQKQFPKNVLNNLPMESYSDRDFVIIPKNTIPVNIFKKENPRTPYSLHQNDSLIALAQRNKLIMRLVVSLIAPDLNPKYVIIDKNHIPSLEVIRSELGQSFIIKHPVGTRGEGVNIINPETQSDFQSIVDNIGSEFVILEEFISNTSELEGKQHQQGLRTYVLYNAENEILHPLSERLDYALDPIKESNEVGNFETSICHSTENRKMTQKHQSSTITCENLEKYKNLFNGLNNLSKADFFDNLLSSPSPLLKKIANKLIQSGLLFEKNGPIFFNHHIFDTNGINMLEKHYDNLTVETKNILFKQISDNLTLYNISMEIENGPIINIDNCDKLKEILTQNNADTKSHYLF